MTVTSPSPLRQSEGHDTTAPASVKAGERQYQSEMMFIGERCHLSACHREDFLPFRCPDCHHQFCSNHYKTADHKCASASATFLVPLCPLCHEPPKNWKRDEDPNIAMNLHLSPNPMTGKIECQAVDVQGIVREDAKGRRPRQKKDNECRERKCRKLMIVPITCPSCRLQFCPSHRAPIQHACPSTQVKAAPVASSNAKNASSKLPSVVSQSKPPSSSAKDPKGKVSESKEPESKSNPLQAIGAVHKGLKMDKWVPIPLFGKA